MTYCPSCNQNIGDDGSRRCPQCGSPCPAAGWPIDRRLGTTVAGHQYRVLRRLGTGGFGTVYEVETMVGELRRALKVLHAERAREVRTRERFVNEAVVLEQLSHPNVARCYSAGTLDGGDELYLLLELVDGPPLSALLAGSNGEPQIMNPLRAVRLAKQVASGLVAVHANGVLHRDLTPRNVLIVNAGAADERVKLVDFGIAGALDAETMTGHTLLGTPRFMAPEQFVTGLELDARCDLWQLGALLHVMLTGVPPGPNAPPVVAADQGLEDLTQKLLAADRENRPRSAVEVCDALARVEHTMLALDHADDAVALLDALCARPSEQAWASVCRFLIARAESSDLVSRAARLLDSWPDYLRRAPLSWWQQVRREGAHPLWGLARSLDLSGHALDDNDVRSLAAQPALSSITRVSLADNHIGNDGLAALARSPHVSQLRYLDLSDNRISAVGVAVFPGMLRQLETLRLARNGLGARGSELIVAADLSLQELDLTANDLGTRGAEILASGRTLEQLTRLRLGDNRIGSDGASAIALSRSLARLRELDLSSNGIGPAGAATLALSLNVANLTTFSLARNALGLEGVELLLSSHRFSSLETLDLSSNDIGPQGAMALASSPVVRRLKALELADNRLGDAGLAALLGAPFLSGLRRLGIAQNGVTAGGVTLLTGAPPETDTLDVSRNPLGEQGLAALAATLPRLRLVTLRLADCELPAHALSDLLEAAPASLAHLEIAGNALGPPWRVRNGDQSPKCRLESVDISRSAVDARGLMALLRQPAVLTIHTLIANSTRLSQADMNLVSALEPLSSLAALHLRDTQLRTVALRALAGSAVAARLHTLDLAFNQLDDSAADVVSHPPGFHALRTLVLDNNDISFASASSILASPAMPLLHTASFARNALKNVVDIHSLARRKVELLEQSFVRAASDGAHLAERFYARLFERYPAVKPLFAQTSMRRQQQHLTSALTMVIEHLRAPDQVTTALEALAARHVGYGAFPSHYQAVTTTLLETLREILGAEWTPELDDAWHDGLDAVAGVMVRAQQHATQNQVHQAR